MMVLQVGNTDRAIPSGLTPFMVNAKRAANMLPTVRPVLFDNQKYDVGRCGAWWSNRRLDGIRANRR